jgi:uncharacterized membrane protein
MALYQRKDPRVEANGLSQAPPHRHRLYRILLSVGAIVLLGYLLVPPLAPLEKVNLIGYTICHQIPDRSFHLAEHRLPLCARCTGTYLGVAIGFASIALLGRWRAGEMLPTWMIVVVVGFIAAMGVDGLNSYLYLLTGHAYLYLPQNWLRAATGSLNGIALSMIVMPVFNYTLWAQPQEERPLVNGWELLGTVAVAAVVVAVVQSEPGWLLYPVALLTTVGVLWMLTLVNTMILLIVLRRDSQARTWRDALASLSMGLTATLIELTVMGTVRYLLTGTLGWPAVPV